MAYERFTPQGPLAMLPLPPREGQQAPGFSGHRFWGDAEQAAPLLRAEAVADVQSLADAAALGLAVAIAVSLLSRRPTSQEPEHVVHPRCTEEDQYRHRP